MRFHSVMVVTVPMTSTVRQEFTSRLPRESSTPSSPWPATMLSVVATQLATRPTRESTAAGMMAMLMS